MYIAEAHMGIATRLDGCGAGGRRPGLAIVPVLARSHPILHFSLKVLYSTLIHNKAWFTNKEVHMDHLPTMYEANINLNDQHALMISYVTLCRLH